MRERLGNIGVGVGIFAIFAFLYLPGVVIAVYSFNKSAVMSWPPEPGSLEWYDAAFSNEAMMEGLKNSVIVAIVSVTIAVVLGIPAGLGVDRFEFRGKVAFQRLLMLPFLMPGLISGLTLLTVMLDFELELSLMTVIVAHATMLIAIVVIQMAVVLDRWDRSLELAAQDLGANEVRTFFYVIWPNIRAAILGASLLGIAVSLDETARTVFVAGQDNTLPVVVLSGLKQTITPEVNAIGTVVLVFSLVAVVIWSKFGAADLARE
ncbi:MAG: ABC transporter permease [Solirubrobacterales bacterium]